MQTDNVTSPAAVENKFPLQAITCSYRGPTNTRGSRIIAKASAGSITVPWNHGMNTYDNYVSAAMALADKWGWSGNWVGGVTASGDYVFCKAT